MGRKSAADELAEVIMAWGGGIIKGLIIGGIIVVILFILVIFST